MKDREFLEILGDIDQEIIDDAAPRLVEKLLVKRKKSVFWTKYVAVAACCAFILVGVLAAGPMLGKIIFPGVYESESDKNDVGEDTFDRNNGIIFGDADKDGLVGGENVENAEPDNGIDVEEPSYSLGDENADVYPDFGGDGEEDVDKTEGETWFDEGKEETDLGGLVPDDGDCGQDKDDEAEKDRFLLALEEKGLYGELTFDTNVAYWQDSAFYPKGIYLNPRLLLGLTDVFYCADGEFVTVENISDLADESVSFSHSGADGYSCIIAVYDNGYVSLFDTFYDLGIEITDKILYNVKTDGVPHGDFSWNERENCWESGKVEKEENETESESVDSEDYGNGEDVFEEET